MIEELLDVKVKIRDRKAFEKLDKENFINYLLKLGMEEEPSSKHIGRIFKYKPKSEIIIIIAEVDNFNFYRSMIDNFDALEAMLDKSQLRILYEVMNYKEEVLNEVTTENLEDAV